MGTENDSEQCKDSRILLRDNFIFPGNICGNICVRACGKTYACACWKHMRVTTPTRHRLSVSSSGIVASMPRTCRSCGPMGQLISRLAKNKGRSLFYRPRQKGTRMPFILHKLAKTLDGTHYYPIKTPFLFASFPEWLGPKILWIPSR